MKRIIGMLLLLVGLTYASQTEQLFKNETTLLWDRRTASGTTTEFTVDSTYVTVIDASDSSWSRVFRSYGSDICARITVSGGTTQYFYLYLLGSVVGSDRMQDQLDTIFSPLYWIKLTGGGPDSTNVQTVQTVIQTTGDYLCLIPPLAAPWLRFLVHSDGSTQSGATTVKIRLYRLEDQLGGH